MCIFWAAINFRMSNKFSPRYRAHASFRFAKMAFESTEKSDHGQSLKFIKYTHSRVGPLINVSSLDVLSYVAHSPTFHLLRRNQSYNPSTSFVFTVYFTVERKSHDTRDGRVVDGLKREKEKNWKRASWRRLRCVGRNKQLHAETNRDLFDKPWNRLRPGHRKN